MNTKPLSLIKIVSGRSLVRKQCNIISLNKIRSSSAESHTKISLNNIMNKKSKENLLPLRDKQVARPKTFIVRPQKLQRLDLNVREVNNSFYKRLVELEPILNSFELNLEASGDLISPVKMRMPN